MFSTWAPQSGLGFLASQAPQSITADCVFKSAGDGHDQYGPGESSWTSEKGDSPWSRFETWVARVASSASVSKAAVGHPGQWWTVCPSIHSSCIVTKRNPLPCSTFYFQWLCFPSLQPQWCVCLTSHPPTPPGGETPKGSHFSISLVGPGWAPTICISNCAQPPSYTTGELYDEQRSKHPVHCSRVSAPRMM